MSFCSSPNCCCWHFQCSIALSFNFKIASGRHYNALTLTAAHAPTLNLHNATHNFILSYNRTKTPLPSPTYPPNSLALVVFVFSLPLLCVLFLFFCFLFCFTGAAAILCCCCCYFTHRCSLPFILLALTTQRLPVRLSAFKCIKLHCCGCFFLVLFSPQFFRHYFAMKSV